MINNVTVNDKLILEYNNQIEKLNNDRRNLEKQFAKETDDENKNYNRAVKKKHDANLLEEHSKKLKEIREKYGCFTALYAPCKRDSDKV